MERQIITKYQVEPLFVIYLLSAIFLIAAQVDRMKVVFSYILTSYQAQSQESLSIHAGVLKWVLI